MSNKIILWGTTVILCLIEIYALTQDSHYKWDFIFLIALLWGLYYLKDQIKLDQFQYGLFTLFLVIHDLGVFGLYDTNIFGMEYDFWVHSFFGLVSALILYRAYSSVGPYHGWFMYVAIIAVVLGFSAFHELFEYAGAVTLGEGEGVLFVGAGDTDPWDTQKDMRNNLLGAIVGLAAYALYIRIREWQDPFYRYRHLTI